MKYLKYAILIGFLSRAFCVGEAGAIFLLINPGAGPAGTGEAQVAKANDAYASYYNPAGLGFLKGSEIVLQHVKAILLLPRKEIIDPIYISNNKILS